MPEILHKISIDSDPKKVYQAISTLPGLAGWWTEDTSGASAPGETVVFRFGKYETRMKVTELQADEKVAWECLGLTPDWVGTRLSFDLGSEKGRTMVRFAHRGWRDDASDFLAHCSMKWATFLLSLKALVETGEGKPFPHDLAI